MLRVAALTVALAVLLLGGAGSVFAHPRVVEPLVAAPLPTSAADTSTALRAAGALESFETSWAIVLAVFLGSAVLVRPRSLRIAAAGLVVLLSVFAVETALHSVHHGLHDGPVACPTASIAAQICGTTIDALTLEAPLAPAGLLRVAPGRGLSSLRPLDPPHGRAPPSALV